MQGSVRKIAGKNAAMWSGVWPLPSMDRTSSDFVLRSLPSVARSPLLAALCIGAAREAMPQNRSAQSESAQARDLLAVMLSFDERW